MSLEVLEDPGELFRTWVATVPELLELVGDRVSIRLAGAALCIRYSIVSATGGYGEGEPLLQAECWGPGGGAPDDGTAGTLARTLAAAVEGADGLLGGVDTGPYQSDDPTSHRPRWILTIRLLTFAS